MKKIALIMCGGQGTRFWPESTSKKPKQYLHLMGQESLLKQSLKRLTGLIQGQDRYLITTDDQIDLALQEGRGEINESEGLILEPQGRNTAPCIFLALLKLLNEGVATDALVAILPSDHVILNQKGFQKTLDKAFECAASEDSIVTIGIRPHLPHTGYGYIKRGEKQGQAYKVERFKEKPNVETAKQYIEDGQYYWNAGMFVSSIGTLLKEFECWAPGIYEFKDELQDLLRDKKDLNLCYKQLDAISIDYAIMEKSHRVQVVEAEFDWNDLGSWDAFENVLEKEDGNYLVGEKSRARYFEHAQNNIVFAPGKFVSLIDVEDLIIISNNDSLVVLPKKSSQKIKNIVADLKKNGPADLL